ncbi:hypothetical protein B0H16DRAFT_1481451 [Mycena metata]|uniref:Uncharacterized protein n=1 Tax=Mycena metata TaxID=1033252 RepID=A0AAD7GYB1_9AGAR|nr:hypothetical protein B0H16DRAFT_1481451 [Mycena metata]
MDANSVPPNIEDAQVSDCGHPIFPSDAHDAEDRFLSDGEEPLLPEGWVAKERARRAEMLQKKADGAQYIVKHPEQPLSTGVWRGLRLDTVWEAANVLKWVARAELGTYNWMDHWLVLLAGNATIGQLPTVNNNIIMVDNEAMVCLAATDAPEDVTTMPLTNTEDDKSVQSATHATFGKAMKLYEKMDTLYWPLGFHVSEQLFTRIGRGVRRCPYSPDVAWWFTVNSLFPEQPDVEGVYMRITVLGEYKYKVLPLEHYPFATTNINGSHVVAWFMQHGIDVNSVVLALKSFAHVQRNTSQNRIDPTLKEFDGPQPRSPANAVRIVAEDVIHWSELHHVPRAGVATTYPEFPGKPTGPIAGCLGVDAHVMCALLESKAQHNASCYATLALVKMRDSEPRPGGEGV